MKKGIRFHDITASCVEDRLRYCKENGVEYIQLVLEKAVEDFRSGEFRGEYAEALGARFSSARIAVLGSYINPSTSDDALLQANIDKFLEKIRYAAYLNPIVVGTETGFFADKPSSLDGGEEAYERLLSTMKLLVSEAERCGVCIGVEGVHCFVINTPRKMKRLMDDLASDSVKVIFDPVNYITAENFGEQDSMIESAFELLCSKIAVIHAKDFAIVDGRTTRVAIGEGLLNFPLIISLMKKYGVDVPIICEEYPESEALLGLAYIEKLYSEIE